jgi:hypothetical protein
MTYDAAKELLACVFSVASPSASRSMAWLVKPLQTCALTRLRRTWTPGSLPLDVLPNTILTTGIRLAPQAAHEPRLLTCFASLMPHFLPKSMTAELAVERRLCHRQLMTRSDKTTLAAPLHPHPHLGPCSHLLPPAPTCSHHWALSVISYLAAGTTRSTWSTH